MEDVVVGIGGLVEQIQAKAELSDADLAALIKNPSGEEVTPASIYRWRHGRHRPRMWAVRALLELARKHGLKVKGTPPKRKR